MNKKGKIKKLGREIEKTIKEDPERAEILAKYWWGIELRMISVGLL